MALRDKTSLLPCIFLMVFALTGCAAIEESTEADNRLERQTALSSVNKTSSVKMNQGQTSQVAAPNRKVEEVPEVLAMIEASHIKESAKTRRKNR